MFARLFAQDVDKLARAGDVAGLSQALQRRDPGQRHKAVEALARLAEGGDGRATTALAAALAHPEPGVHQGARAVLVSLGADAALRTALWRLDAGDQARTLALRALIELGVPDLAALLSRALADPSAELRKLAAQNGAVPTSLHPEDPARHRREIEAMARTGTDHERLLAALSNRDVGVRVNAVFGLAGLDARAVKTALSDPAAPVRAAAARGLAQHPDSRDALVAALKDPASEVASAAAASLGAIGDRAAVQPLILALSAGLAEAGRALGRLGDARALQPLITALDEPDLADLAAIGLGELGDPAAIPALTHLSRTWVRDPSLRPDDPDAGSLAAEAIRKLRG